MQWVSGGIWELYKLPGDAEVADWAMDHTWKSKVERAGARIST